MKTLMTLVLAAASLTTTLATTAKAQGPRTAPEFVINMPDGSQKLLSSFKGKPVCLAFFFTTCPHCQDMALKTLSPLVPEYAPKGVQFLAAAFDDGAKEGTSSFASQYVRGFPMGWAERGSVLEFLQVSIMTPLYVPIMVFIDRNGKVQDQFIGDPTFLRDPAKNTRAELDKILAVKAVAPISKNTRSAKTTRISKK
jgi:peroxiredoxin